MIKKLNKAVMIFLSIILFFCLTACKSSDKETKDSAQNKSSESVYTEDLKVKFPEKAIKIVVPFSAGGGTDNVARALAVVSKDYFSQPIIVVNKTGGSGSIGLTEGALAKPDGYTVTLTPGELSILHHQGKATVSYNDFKPILQLNEDSAALTVRADAPWNTVQEFISYAKKNPGRLKVGNSGEGAIWHLAARAIENETGVALRHVPFDGAAPAAVALLGGEIDAVTVSSGEVMTHVNNGELKILGVMSNNRLSYLPQVPTFKESNIDIQIVTWRGISVPKDTPDEIVDILQNGFSSAASDENFKDILTKLNLGYRLSDAENFQKIMKDSDEFYKQLLLELKIIKK